APRSSRAMLDQRPPAGKPGPVKTVRARPRLAPRHLRRVGPEVLGKLESLRLVAGTESGAVEPVGRFGQPLVDQTADGLAVAKEKRHLTAAHLEHRPTAGAAGGGMAEAGVEESGIVDTELADQRIERHHLGG